MLDSPYEIPQEWQNSLEKLRERVKSYPEDPEDRAIRVYDEKFETMSPEDQARLRKLEFCGDLRVAIDEAIFDHDLEI